MGCTGLRHVAAAIVAFLFWQDCSSLRAADAVAGVEIRGVVRAEIEATLANEVIARITAFPLKVGQSFQKGDLLVAFGCERLEADLKAANAQLKASAVTLRQNKRLLKYQAGGVSDVEIAEAKHEEAKAVAEAIKVKLNACTIHAPFDGRVAARHVEVFETPQANAPLLDIVKEGASELELIVPSSWVAHLKPGQTFNFRIDETQTTYEAAIINLGAVVDPISRTIVVRARLLSGAASVRPGMSGTAELAPPHG